MEEPLVSVIILNYNGRRFLKRCFESVFRQNYKNFEVIMADNGSSDGSVDYVKRNFPKVSVVENRKNLGFSAGSNAGIDAAKGDYVVVCNNDVEFFKDWLKELVSVARSSDTIGIVGSQVLAFDGTPEPSPPTKPSQMLIPFSFRALNPKKSFTLNREGTKKGDSCTYAVVQTHGLMPMKVLEKVGKYDPRFFAYCEETDLCWRVTKAGYRIVVNPKSRFYHLGSGTIRYGTPFQVYNSCKSRMLFGIKNLGILTKMLYMSVHVLYYTYSIFVLCARSRPDLAKAIASAMKWNIKEALL